MCVNSMFYHNLPTHTHTHTHTHTVSQIIAFDAGPTPTPPPSTSSASITCTCTCPTTAVTILPTSRPGKTILQCYKRFTFVYLPCVFAASHLLSIDVSTAVGITFSITFIMAFSLGVLVTVCISCVIKTRSKTTSPHPSTPYDVVGRNQKKIDVIPLESNDAYGTVK